MKDFASSSYDNFIIQLYGECCTYKRPFEPVDCIIVENVASVYWQHCVSIDFGFWNEK